MFVKKILKGHPCKKITTTKIQRKHGDKNNNFKGKKLVVRQEMGNGEAKAKLCARSEYI